MKPMLLLLGLVILITFMLIPGTALGWTPPGYGLPLAAPYPGAEDLRMAPTAQGFRVERDADRDNYYLTVYVTGMLPQELTVAVEGGRWLAVRAEDTSEYTYEDIAPDRRRYTRSFSYSSGSAARRFRLPRDADLAAMRREDDEKWVRIVIPRLR